MNHVGRIRLLTQCRQLYTFSHAYLFTQDKTWLSPLAGLFEFTTQKYWQKDQWIFSLDDQLEVNNSHSDCYALAFVLLSFSYYHQATGDRRALEYIEKTHVFLQAKMAHPRGGFHETYPVEKEQVRRQNPHMHLLEGYLAAYATACSTTQLETYKTQIRKLLDLCIRYFFDEQTNCLIEFFHEDWSIDATMGYHIEPGHHFEWIWLLHKADQVFPDPRHQQIADALWNSAMADGFDPNGGIYNQIDAQTGRVIDVEKRIWPITEYLKALCARSKHHPGLETEISKSLNFMFTHYLNQDGSWNEYLNKDNTPKAYPLPGTSSYHLFLGLTEVITWHKSVTADSQANSY